MLETILATLAQGPFKLAGALTSIALFVAAGVAVHRSSRGHFTGPWIVWSYLVNGIAITLYFLLTTDLSERETRPIVLYGIGVLSGAVSIIAWPMMWLWAIFFSLWEIGSRPWIIVVVLASPAVVPFIGATLVPRLFRWWSQRSSRRDAASTIGA